MTGAKKLGSMSVTLAILLLLPLAGCAPSRAAQDTTVVESQPPKPVINPLTGEAVSSLDCISRRPLAVKVENDPKARPQSGIIDADLVYEEIVEGGVTRFMCIYLSKDCSAIGPTRSARISDIDMAFFLNPLLICSGGAPNVMAAVKASGLLYIEEDSQHFWRDRKKPAPHNLYTSTDRLRQYLAQSGDTFNALPVSGLAFGQTAQDQAQQDGQTSAEGGAGTPATAIKIPYKSVICTGEWQYDAASDTYLHSINGTPHTDLTTGKRVAFRNVIVQYVKLVDSGARDVTGAPVPTTQVVGSGKCLVFSGGKVQSGTWKKASRSSPTEFVDSEDNPIELRAGQTWIHLVTDDIGAQYQ
jgi:hypothetical protein